MEITQELLMEIVQGLELGGDPDGKKELNRNELLAITEIITEDSIRPTHGESPSKFCRITFSNPDFDEVEIFLQYPNSSGPWLCTVQAFSSHGDELKIEGARCGDQERIEELYNSLSKPEEAEPGKTE